MTIKFGSITNPSKEILKEIGDIMKNGFDFVEIGMEGPKAMPSSILRKRDKILSLLKKYKTFAIGHTAFWINLGSPYESVRKAWIEESKRMIETARELGMKYLNFHLYSKGMFYRDRKMSGKILDNHVKSLKELVEHGKNHGVGIMLENGHHEFDLSSLENYGYVLRKVRGLNAHIDVGHAMLGKDMGYAISFLTRFRKRLVHIHISDNYGVKDDHLPVTIGMLDLEKLVKTLKKIGYNKTITFEVFANDRSLAKFSMKKFRDAWRKRK